MSKELFRNSATGLLDNNPVGGSTYSVTDTLFALQSGESLFPSPVTAEHFLVVLQSVSGAIEICKCTNRTTSNFTLERAQDNTVALTWNPGDRMEMRPAAASMDQMLQNQNDRLEGPLDANQQNISDAVLVGGVTQGTNVRALDNATTNQLAIPNAGADPTIGGAIIWTQANLLPTDQRFYNPPGSITMFNGDIAPTGWWLCDGSFPFDDTGGGAKPAPDLRGRFVLGYNNTSGTNPGPTTGPIEIDTLLSTGGDYERIASIAPSHNHSGVSGDTTLSEGQMPAHTHKLGEVGDNESSSGLIGAGGFQYPQAEYTSRSAGGGLPHSHTTDSDGVHNHLLDKDQMAPYVVLSFIIKLDINNRVP
tara:strand:+ start:497 stop:1585 length:1089 start_codon:yes stop_codon:yes gene_type:complete